MAEVVLIDVSKLHPDGTVALDGIDLKVADGEFVVVVGPGGSGKSTLLRLIAGIERASGGAVTVEGDVRIVDGPLSNLEIPSSFGERGHITTLYATDDPVEAMMLADRIVVLDAGRLQQMGTPEEILNQPANTFVAGYLGSPAMNLGSGALFDFSDNLVIGLRPTAFALGEAGPRCMNVTAITVERLDDQRYVLFQPTPWTPMWTAAIGADADVVPGQNITLTVDLRQAHFFDAATGSAIGPGA